MTSFDKTTFEGSANVEAFPDEGSFIASTVNEASFEEILPDDRPLDDRPLDDRHLWPGDSGTLTLKARTALLQLIKGPYIHETRDAELWAALLANRRSIEERLADIFLELVIHSESGIAFARNVRSGDIEVPKTTRTNTMTLLDSIMVLTLRRELMTGGPGRVFIGQDELFDALSQYRNIDRIDPASFVDRLKTSWNRLIEARLLLKTEAEGRFEISPILKLVFGVEEARAVEEAFHQMAQAAAPEGETVLEDDEAGGLNAHEVGKTDGTAGGAADALKAASARGHLQEAEED